MLQQSLEQTAGKTIGELRETYLQKTGKQLPEKAKKESWSIRFDHCFQRVILDNMTGDTWYNQINGRPAYKHLTRQQLRKAIEIADRMLEEGKPTVEKLNQKSLEYRNTV